MFDFGLRIRELREKHKLSQEELGRRIGRSKSVISSYENNLKVPPLDILTQLAVLFNVSLDYLVGIDKDKMISIEALTDEQKDLIQATVQELKSPRSKIPGLSKMQQDIINRLIVEFTKR